MRHPLHAIHRRTPRAFVTTLLVSPLLFASRSQAQQPASTTPPSLAAPTTLRIPPIAERTLPNGLRIAIVEQHDVPVVDMMLVVRRGSEADPAGQSGLATLTASLLSEGAGTRDAVALADQIGFLAIRLNASAGLEQSTVSLHSTRATLDSGLALMADMVLRPRFTDADITRLRNVRLTSLLQESDRGPSMADRAFAALVYGPDHPYGRMPAGTRDDVERMSANDVRSFWRTWYRPNNATLIIAGDLTVAEALMKASAAFGTWSRGTLPVLRTVKAPAAAPTTITLIDKPRAAQSSFRIGGVGVARSTPDYYALQVMNTALGGSFTSRLNQNLRETKGYTYGASSGFAMRREAGPFTARAEVVAAKTDSALLEFLRELNVIRSPMPATELAKTKTSLQLSYAERFETSGDLAREIATLVPVGIPLSTLRQYQARMAAVTRGDVQRVAQQHLNPASLTIVIAGDTATLAPALRALKIAPVTVRDARGRPIITP